MAPDKDRLSDLQKVRMALEQQIKERDLNLRRNRKCGNCLADLQDDDKYCRYCGTARGEGKFEPSRNMMQELYGPPPGKRVRKCTQCGHCWSTYVMVDSEKICPECGAPCDIAPGKSR